MSMSVPVTTRLSEQTVAALNSAVEEGKAPDRASLVAVAVEEWLDRHSRERITESYRRTYVEPDQELDEINAAFLADATWPDER